MRNQRRNEQTVWYALYEGEYPKTNAAGKRTGESVQEYSAPVETRMSVSAAKGSADVELFGVDTDYTKTLITHDMECPITETSVLWINADPLTDEYNHVVVKIATSLNTKVYAVREVKVT